jgi:hypothetical protein
MTSRINSSVMKDTRASRAGGRIKPPPFLPTQSKVAASVRPMENSYSQLRLFIQSAVSDSKRFHSGGGKGTLD